MNFLLKFIDVSIKKNDVGVCLRRLKTHCIWLSNLRREIWQMKQGSNLKAFSHNEIVHL